MKKWFPFPALSLMLILVTSACRPSPTSRPDPTQPPSSPTPRRSTPTPTSTPDWLATSTAIVAAVIALGQAETLATYPSPDWGWRADVEAYACVHVPGSEIEANAYEQLRIHNLQDDISVVVDGQVINCGGLGAAGLAGLFWSEDSRFFYYTNAREGLPDGGCGYWASPILRLDLETMSTVYLGGGPVSPDGSLLAARDGPELVVWDLAGDLLARISLAAPDAPVHAITWSPDSQSLIYIQTANCWHPFGMTRVVRIDWPPAVATVLYQSEETGFVHATWDTPAYLALFDSEGREWRLDLESGELTPPP